MRTHSTGAKPRFGFGLTGRPKVGMLIVSSYQPSRQTGFGCSLKASLLRKARLSRIHAHYRHHDNTPNSNFHILFAFFAFVFCSLGGRLLVGGESFEGEDWCCDHMTERVEKQIGAAPAVETKLHFFEVGCEMFRAQAMPGSHDAALQERESRFDSVGVNVSHDVHARTVLNGFVHSTSTLLDRYGVRGSIVRENYVHILRDVLADVPCQRSGLRIVGMEEAEIAVALANPDYDFFVVHASDAAFSAIHSADVGSIHLHFAVEHGLFGLRHCVTDAMAEVPGRLVGHSDRTLDLQSGHALFGLAEQVGNEKPLGQRQVGVVKNGARGNGKLVIAIFAVEELLFGLKLNDGHLAAQAARTFGPAEPHKQFPAFIFGSEQGVYIH